MTFHYENISDENSFDVSEGVPNSEWKGKSSSCKGTKKNTRLTDNENARIAFTKLVERMDGDDKDKAKLLAIAKRLLENKGSSELLDRAFLLALPYAEYLKTKHWSEVRNKTIRDAHKRCSLCNSGGELHCHHRTYQSLGNEKNNDVICLCKDCHQVFHDHRKVEGQFSAVKEYPIN